MLKEASDELCVERRADAPEDSWDRGAVRDESGFQGEVLSAELQSLIL